MRTIAAGCPLEQSESSTEQRAFLQASAGSDSASGFYAEIANLLHWLSEGLSAT